MTFDFSRYPVVPNYRYLASMTTIIRKNAKPSEVKKLMIRIKLKPKKPFNPQQYSGVMKISKDPLELQKEWRRDWDRLS
jgi:hypothetical protein